MSDQVLIDGRRVGDRLPLRTLFYGEGVFETFRYKSALPVFFDMHYGRMREGAETLGIPAPEKSRIEDLVTKAVRESGFSDAYVKVCLLSDGDIRFSGLSDRGSVLVVVKGFIAQESPVKACVNPFRRGSESPVRRIKSMNYLECVLARRGAAASGFDEALFLNERGEVAEGSACNIFWVKDGTLYTPTIDCGILPGITRRVLLDHAPVLGLDVEEGHYLLSDLTGAEFAFFTNSLTGALPVSHLDTHSFPVGGAVFQGIKNLLLNKLEWD